jgi:uncharacterized protein YraI
MAAMHTSRKQVLLSLASMVIVTVACNTSLTGSPAPEATSPPEASPLPQASDTPSPIPPTATPVPTQEPTSTPTPVATATPANPFVSPLGAEDIACRWGPGEEYSIDGGLKVGERVPVTGRDSLSDWLQIGNPRREGKFCWVSVAQVQVEGEPALAPVLQAPASIVAAVTVTLKPKDLQAPGCTFPVTFNVSFSISTTGPTKVTFNRSKSDGSKTDPETVEFKTSGTKSFSDSYRVGAEGDYWFSVNVSSPNVMSVRGEGTVTCP